MAMSKQIKIKPERVLTDAELQPKPLDLSDKKTAVHEFAHYPEPKPSFFKDTAFGRTLSLRNTTGKTIAGVGVSAIAALTGIKLNLIPNQILKPMDFIQDLFQTFAQSQDWVIIAISITVFLTTALISFFVSKGYITKSIAKKINNVIENVAATKHPDSPGGVKTTPEERQEIMQEVLKGFGIEIKDDSEKPPTN